MPKSSRKIDFCTIQIDRMAMMYDWFITLACSHMLAAGAAENPNQEQNHTDAQNLCLRMALSVLVWAAELILHETGHNLDLWHCGKNSKEENKASCIQDVIKNVWKAHTMARLGLAHIDVFINDDDARSTLRWNALLYGPVERDDANKVGMFVVKDVQCKSKGRDLKTERLYWGVDHPLVMDGRLTVCVFGGRPDECNPLGSKYTNCFQQNSPDGVLDCENEIKDIHESSVV